jgi:transcriptional regulator with XRE-family HTH domain
MAKAEFTARRKALGLSQNEVARRVGMEQGAFSRVVNGARPASATWKRVRRLFGRLERRRERAA